MPHRLLLYCTLYGMLCLLSLSLAGLRLACDLLASLAFDLLPPPLELATHPFATDVFSLLFPFVPFIDGTYLKFSSKVFFPLHF